MLRTASAIALFTLLALTLPVGAASLDAFAPHFSAPKPSENLPNFVFEDGKGRSLRLADFHGTPVLLNLWATWCGPCVEEMPALDKLQSMMGDRLAIVALDEEHNASPDSIAVFFKRHEISNLVIYNDPTARIASTLRAGGLPTSFLIDRDGHVIGRIEGAVDWSAPATVAFLREHLMN